MHQLVAQPLQHLGGILVRFFSTTPGDLLAFLDNAVGFGLGCGDQGSFAEQFHGALPRLMHNPLSLGLGIGNDAVTLGDRALALAYRTGHIDPHSLQQVFDVAGAHEAIG